MSFRQTLAAGESRGRKATGPRLLRDAVAAASDATKDPKIAEPPKGSSAFVLSRPETTRWRHLLPLATRGLIGTEAWLEIRLMDGTYDWSPSSQCHGG